MTADIIQHFRTRLRAGDDILQLLPEIASARQVHPGVFHLELLYADALLQSAALEDAKAHIEALQASFPQHWQPDLKLATLYFHTGDDAYMQDALDRSQALGAPEAPIRRLEARVALRQGRYRVALDKFQRLAELTQPNVGNLLQQATLFYKLREYPQALAAIEQVLALQPDAKLPTSLGHSIIEANGVEKGIELLTRMSECHPDNTRLTSALARLLDDCGRTAELLDLYRSRKHSFDEQALTLVMSQDLPEDLHEDIATYVAETTEQSPVRRIVMAWHWHLSRGDTQAANRLERVLRPHLCHIPTGKSAAGIVANSHLSPRARLNDRGSPETTSILSPENRGLVLAFSGLKGGLLDFNKQGDSLLTQYLATLGLSVIYLKDNQRLLFLNGIASLAKDYASTVARLRELIAESGVTRLFTLATSGGGFAAIRYGLALGAECALCFSPPTNLTRDFLRQDPRGKVVQYRLGKHFSDDILDLRPQLQKATSRMDVHIYYGDAHPDDRRHAEHLQGAPGVTLHPFQGINEHSSFLHLEQQDRLRDTFIQHYRLTPL
jgi:tetratricopeptide (TPR) repeat protein